MPENKDRINHPFVYSMSASLIGLWSITQRLMEDYSGPRLAIKYRGTF